jgi:hypothetical protein
VLGNGGGLAHRPRLQKMRASIAYMLSDVAGPWRLRSPMPNAHVSLARRLESKRVLYWVSEIPMDARRVPQVD